MRLLLFVLLLVPLFSYTQGLPSFTLTPEGLVNASDNTKDYVVLEINGISKEELYKKVLLFANRTYISPKDVISKVENESITLTGFAPKVVKRNNMHVFDMDYTINMEFKDNKIKVIPSSFKLTSFVFRPQTLWLVSKHSLDGSDLGIYNPKGKLMSEMAKKDVENFFNAYIIVLQKTLSETNSDW